MIHIRILTTWLAMAVVAPSAASAQERTISLTIANMTCFTCPIVVDKAISRLPGIKAVTVDLDGNTAEVVFDDELTSIASIISASSNAGFPATPTE